MAKMHPDDIEDYEEATEGEKRTNPDKQTWGYVNTLKERLEEFPEFLSELLNIGHITRKLEKQGGGGGLTMLWPKLWEQ